MKNNVENLKICSKCEVAKQDSDFESSKITWCINCRNEYKLRIAEDNKKQTKEIKRNDKQKRRHKQAMYNDEILALQEENKVRKKIKAMQEFLVKNNLFKAKKETVLKQIGEQWFWVTE